MLKQSLYVAAALLSLNSLEAARKNPTRNKKEPPRNVFLEGKAAYYLPADAGFRDIYGGGGMYGFEVSVQAWRKIYGWTSASYFHREGKSTGKQGGSSTEVTLVPAGLGIKFVFPSSKVDSYLGIGALPTYAHFKDHSPSVISSSSRWGIGGIVKGGVIFKIHPHFLVGLFTDYSFVEVNFENTNGDKVVRHKANLSGWSIGGSLGYRF